MKFNHHTVKNTKLSIQSWCIFRIWIYEYITIGEVVVPIIKENSQVWPHWNFKIHIFRKGIKSIWSQISKNALNAKAPSFGKLQDRLCARVGWFSKKLIVVCADSAKAARQVVCADSVKKAPRQLIVVSADSAARAEWAKQSGEISKLIPSWLVCGLSRGLVSKILKSSSLPTTMTMTLLLTILPTTGSAGERKCKFLKDNLSQLGSENIWVCW